VVKAKKKWIRAVLAAWSWLRRKVLPSIARKVRAVGPGLSHPGGEGGREKGRADAVHKPQNLEPRVGDRAHN